MSDELNARHVARVPAMLVIFHRQQLRQLRYVHRDAPGFVAAQ